MKIKPPYFLLLFAFIGLISWKTNPQNLPAADTGMIKVTILYPNGDDKTFNMDYYEKKHMPMVAGFIGSKNLRYYEIDKVISGRTANDKPPFLAIGYFYINNLADYNAAIAQNREVIINDFKNYTNVQPVVQISEVKQVMTGK